MTDVQVLFNPACSKCRTTQGILADHGIEAEYVDYLHQPPSVAELRRILTMLGTDDVRAIARQGEPLWAKLHLATASDDEVLDALVRHPILIERPIVIAGGRAVVARPPDRVLELLDESPGGDQPASTTGTS